MPKVTIIMPLYNKADSVERSIFSIQHQTYIDWHLIIVDDGSTDNSFDVVSKIKDDRIEIIQQKNQGAGPARNTGIAKTTSEYLAFLDADDEWYPWYLENAINAMENNDVSMVASMYYRWPAKTDMTDYWKQRDITPGLYSIKPTDEPLKITNLLMFLQPWNCVVKTDLAKKCDGYYPCIYGEDRIFCVRVALTSDLMIIDPPSVRYHSESSGVVSSCSAKRIEEFITHPETLLDYCDDNRKDLINKFIDHHALMSAQVCIKAGARSLARKILKLRPGTKKLGQEYIDCYKRTVPGFYTWQWIKNNIIRRHRKQTPQPKANPEPAKQNTAPSLPWDNETDN